VITKDQFTEAWQHADRAAANAEQLIQKFGQGASTPEAANLFLRAKTLRAHADALLRQLIDWETTHQDGQRSGREEEVELRGALEKLEAKVAEAQSTLDSPNAPGWLRREADLLREEARRIRELLASAPAARES